MYQGYTEVIVFILLFCSRKFIGRMFKHVISIKIEQNEWNEIQYFDCKQFQSRIRKSEWNAKIWYFKPISAFGKPVNWYLRMDLTKINIQIVLTLLSVTWIEQTVKWKLEKCVFFSYFLSIYLQTRFMCYIYFYPTSSICMFKPNKSNNRKKKHNDAILKWMRQKLQFNIHISNSLFQPQIRNKHGE